MTEFNDIFSSPLANIVFQSASGVLVAVYAMVAIWVVSQRDEKPFKSALHPVG
jgi:hypothetical protein